MTTTQDITELIHTLRHEPMRPSTVLQTSVALEALVAERDQLRATVYTDNSDTIANMQAEIDALLAENGKLSDLWSAMKAERNALRARLEQAERQEPYVYMDQFGEVWGKEIDAAENMRNGESPTKLYTHPAPQPAALQPLKYNTWTHNDGDSWSEHPADAEIIYDLLGDNPKVGDEFQLRASVESVQQTYRITSVSSDGECEVELVEAAHGIGAKP